MSGYEVQGLEIQSLSPLIPQANSRLGCQITVTEEMAGLVVRLPLGQH